MPDCPDGSGPGTFNITIDGKKIDFPVTGAVLEMQGNYQFLHTLDNFIYYYSFGDRIGEMIVSGIGFIGSSCSTSPTGGSAGASNNGICGLYQLYMEKRGAVLGARDIKIGNDDCNIQPLRAFLTGMRMEVTAGQQSPIGQWTLRFHVLPPRITSAS
jgi:hypothetical protein